MIWTGLIATPTANGNTSLMARPTGPDASAARRGQRSSAATRKPMLPVELVGSLL
jgi:hypothetical protein